MSNPVDRSQGPDQSQETGGEYWDEPNYDFDDGYTDKSTTKPKGPQTKGYGTTGTSGRTGAQGTAPKQSGFGPQPGGISPGGEFSSPETSQAEVANYAQNLKNQGYTNQQIKQAIFNEFGFMPTDGDVDYFLNGHLNRNNRGGSKYMGYPSGPLAKQYGPGSSSYLMQYFMDQQMMGEAKDMARSARTKGRQQMVKMHMILLLIMMGDITGAMRAYTQLMDRDMRQFARGVMRKLGLVRRARARVIRNFANAKPPRAYAGENPQSAARAQDQAQRYTQYVQLSTQLMGELQSTERELVDILQTMKRDVDNFMQGYASMRDNDFRVAERLMTIR